MIPKSGRTIIATKPRSLKTALFRWETFLILIFILVNIMNISLSSKYLHVERLFTTINTFLVKGFIALPMAYVLVMGEIDLSVGSTVALSAALLGVSYNAGLPMGVAVVICLLCGLLCGMLNGLILTKFTELAPMIVTLGTMTLYRGVGEMILGNESTGGMQDVKWFYDLYYARIGPIPYMFILFVVLAVAFGIVLHKTTFGRKVYAIGSNRLAAAYSGIKVQKIRFIVYSLVGLTCGLSALFYSSWMGTVRSDIATGYELEAISMVVLGGISTVGGKGNFPGTVISIFIIGLLKYGLGLINVTSQTMLVIVGAILIIVVMAPNLRIGRFFKGHVKKKAVE
jgi:rhamnose transport system permease protein